MTLVSEASPKLEIYPEIIDIRPVINFKNTSSYQGEIFDVNKTLQSKKYLEEISVNVSQ
jgi:hypothetical protein